MLSMLRQRIVLVCVICVAALLGGCSPEEPRQIGTSDARIVGNWIARELTYDGETVACPGVIELDNGSIECRDSISFVAEGQYTQAGETDEFFFDGGTLALYNSDNSSIFGVVFHGTGNTMTWTTNVNGRPATRFRSWPPRPAARFFPRPDRWR